MAGQVVQITINVTDGNAAEAVQQVVAQLNAIGPAGERAGAVAGAGLDQVSEHALSSRENVKLLNEDLGLHIPRAMQAAMMESQLLVGAINMIGPALIGMGAVDIFVHMGESIYGAYEKFVSLDAAQEKFIKAQKENREKDFINVHSIETAVERLEQAQNSMVNMKALAEDLSHSGWTNVIGGLLTGNIGQMGSGAGQVTMASSAADASVQKAQQAKDIQIAQNALFHEGVLAQIEADHAGDSALKGHAKITAELKKQLDIDREKTAYIEVQSSALGNMGAVSAGLTEKESADAAARAKAHAEDIDLQRQETNQIIQMHNEAVNAGLEGNALRAAQEMQQIDAITRKFQEGEISKRAEIAETAAIKQKFGAEAVKLQQQLDEQTQHLANEANQAGMKGMQLLSAQLQTQLDAIDAAERRAVGIGGIETSGQSADFNSQRDSARHASAQKGIEEQANYEQKIQSLMSSSDSAALQGYARIESEKKRHLALLSQADIEYYGDLGVAMGIYQDQAVVVEADADRQRQQLHHRTMEELTKEEQEAARMLLPEWQQSLLAIEDQYDERKRRIDQDVHTQVMTETEGARAVTDAWNLAAVQMQRSQEETRDRLASGLRSLFSNPAQFFEKRAMDTAFQLMANEMLSVFQSSGATGGILQYIFGMGPEMNTSTNPLHALGSAFRGSIQGTRDLSSLTSNITDPSSIAFQQGSTMLLSGSQALLTASTSLQSSFGSMAFGGGTAGIGSSLFGGGSSGFGSDVASGFGMSGGTGTAGIQSVAGAAPSLSLAGGNGSYITAAGNSVVDASSLGVAGSGVSSSLSSSGGSGGKALGATMGMAGGALMAGTSIYSAYQNSDPASGAIGGAMGGMEFGAALGSVVPGLGTVAGAAIGAIVGGTAGVLAGIFGDQGKGKAQDLDKNTVTPGIMAELQQFNNGTTGYEQATQYLQQLQLSAQSSTRGWGNGANDWFTGHILPEIRAAQLELDREEKGGRSLLSMSAAQYHSGGRVGGFGDLATGPGEGLAKLLSDEFVVQPMAARSHSSLLNAINTGNVSYSSMVQPRMPASSVGGGAPISITAWDGKSIDTWLRNGGATKLRQAGSIATQQYGGQGAR